jgi:hypothetical protein
MKAQEATSIVGYSSFPEKEAESVCSAPQKSHTLFV